MAHLKGPEIVIDEIAYDCSSRAHEHPGGDSVTRSFGDHDCSWQFWRFYNKDMAEYRQVLRIGKTQGVERAQEVFPTMGV